MRVSVVIPLYNKKDIVMRALNSVLAQIYLPHEIILVNDGSTDGSEKIVEKFNHPLIRLINQENSGVSAARNKGIEEAKEEWIAFLDADDEWNNEFLKWIKLLNQRYPACDVLASSYELVDHRGSRETIQIRKLEFDGEDGILGNYFEVAANSNPPICSSAVVIRKKALLQVSGFPVGVKSGEDLITWAKLATISKIAYTRKNLAVFHLDAAHSYDEKPNRVPEINDVVGKTLTELYNLNKISGLKEYISHWYKMRASIYLRLGQRNNAFKESLKALKFNMKNKKVYIYLILLFLPTFLINKVFKRFSANEGSNTSH